MTSTRLRRLGLRQALSLGAMQSLLRMVLGFASIKVTAVWIGPGGLALVAQINNFIGLCQGVIANPAGTAVVRLGSEFADQPENRRQVTSTAMQLVIGCGLALALPVALSAAWLSPQLLAGQSHLLALVLAAIAIPALAFTNIVVSAFNAVGELSVLSRIQMWGTVAGFVIFVPSAYLFGIEGALLATSATYLVGAAIAALFLRRHSTVGWSDFAQPMTREMTLRTLRFYPMLIVHAALTPLTLLVLRDQIVTRVGLDSAGLWQAGWRLSETYLALLMAPFSMYFMAKLGSLARDRPQFRQEVLRSTLRAAAVTAPVALAIFLLRAWIVRILFAPSFAPVVDLIPWQLAGDVVKMTAWVLTMTLTALMRGRWFVACELARAATFVAVAMAFMDRHGPVAANWGYFAANVVQIGMATFGLRDLLLLKSDDDKEGGP
jgi:PST family polysaccharide transporter